MEGDVVVSSGGVVVAVASAVQLGGLPVVVDEYVWSVADERGVG